MKRDSDLIVRNNQHMRKNGAMAIRQNNLGDYPLEMVEQEPDYKIVEI